MMTSAMFDFLLLAVHFIALCFTALSVCCVLVLFPHTLTNDTCTRSMTTDRDTVYSYQYYHENIKHHDRNTDQNHHEKIFFQGFLLQHEKQSHITIDKRYQLRYYDYYLTITSQTTRSSSCRPWPWASALSCFALEWTPPVSSERPRPSDLIRLTS